MIGLLIAAFESITERGKGQVDKSKGEMKGTVQETKEERKREDAKSKGHVKSTRESKHVPKEGN
jgi:hypothetical protein